MLKSKVLSFFCSRRTLCKLTSIMYKVSKTFKGVDNIKLSIVRYFLGVRLVGGPTSQYDVWSSSKLTEGYYQLIINCSGR